jgi:hypothetical protein
MPLHRENFFHKLKRKNTGKLMNTDTLINEGKTDKSFAPFTYCSQV